LSGWPEAKIGARVRELLELVKLDPDTYARRYPAELSGGQRQRVGVARALMVQPRLILMDEPFGALDPLTRHDLQDDLVALRKRIETTIVFVTHDLGEALTRALGMVLVLSIIFS
ncbi:ATP-binding cassette domain-containing protein, partial [Lacticaseibacillus rhamnosus]